MAQAPSVAPVSPKRYESGFSRSSPTTPSRLWPLLPLLIQGWEYKEGALMGCEVHSGYRARFFRDRSCSS